MSSTPSVAELQKAKGRYEPPTEQSDLALISVKEVDQQRGRIDWLEAHEKELWDRQPNVAELMRRRGPDPMPTMGVNDRFAKMTCDEITALKVQERSERRLRLESNRAASRKSRQTAITDPDVAGPSVQPLELGVGNEDTYFLGDGGDGFGCDYDFGDGFGEVGYDEIGEPLNDGVLEQLNQLVADQPWSGVVTDTSDHQPLPHNNDQSDAQTDLELYWKQLKNPTGDTLIKRLTDVDFVLAGWDSDDRVIDVSRSGLDCVLPTADQNLPYVSLLCLYDKH